MMLRVFQVSGEELAAFAPEELSSVGALKRCLRAREGLPAPGVDFGNGCFVLAFFSGWLLGLELFLGFCRNYKKEPTVELLRGFRRQPIYGTVGNRMVKFYRARIQTPKLRPKP